MKTLYWTDLILKAANAAHSVGDRDMNYYVHCAYGECMGYGSTDSLSLNVKAELETLGYQW